MFRSISTTFALLALMSTNLCASAKESSYSERKPDDGVPYTISLCGGWHPKTFTWGKHADIASHGYSDAEGDIMHVSCQSEPDNELLSMAKTTMSKAAARPEEHFVKIDSGMLHGGLFGLRLAPYHKPYVLEEAGDLINGHVYISIDIMFTHFPSKNDLACARNMLLSIRLLPHTGR